MKLPTAHDETIYERIDQRKAAIAERMPMVMRNIEHEFSKIQPLVNSKLNQVMTENSSRRTKVIKIQELVSDVRSISNQYAACRDGCSTCCTQRVMLSQTEADAIGYKIGLPAIQLKHGYVLPETHEFGKDTPCTFLKNDRCSIYEHRPVMCRNAVNLDVDSLLCGFENWDLDKRKDKRFTGIPMLGLGPLMAAYQKTAGSDCVGDIRAFFPQQL